MINKDALSATRFAEPVMSYKLMICSQSAEKKDQRTSAMWSGKVNDVIARIILQILTSVEETKCNLATATGTAGILGSLSGCAPRKPLAYPSCMIKPVLLYLECADSASYRLVDHCGTHS